MATATLTITSIRSTTPGAGYSKADVAITDPNRNRSDSDRDRDNGVISAITLKKPAPATSPAASRSSWTRCRASARRRRTTSASTSRSPTPRQPERGDGWAPATWKGPTADYYLIGADPVHAADAHGPAGDDAARVRAADDVASRRARSLAPNRTTDPVSGDPALLRWTTRTYLGPMIVATKDKPVRIVFYNLLPTGDGGDLFLPADSTLMGSGDGADGRHGRSRSTRARSRTRSATRCAPSTRRPRQLLHGQPGDAAPARRRHPVDQRRDAAPVDHAGRRDHAVAAGRQRQNVPDMVGAADTCRTARRDGCRRSTTRTSRARG